MIRTYQPPLWIYGHMHSSLLSDRTDTSCLQPPRIPPRQAEPEIRSLAGYRSLRIERSSVASVSNDDRHVILDQMSSFVDAQHSYSAVADLDLVDRTWVLLDQPKGGQRLIE